MFLKNNTFVRRHVPGHIARSEILKQTNIVWLDRLAPVLYANRRRKISNGTKVVILFRASFLNFFVNVLDVTI